MQKGDRIAFAGWRRMFIVFLIDRKLCENIGVAEERQCVLDCGGFLERGWMCR